MPRVEVVNFLLKSAFPVNIFIFQSLLLWASYMSLRDVQTYKTERGTCIVSVFLLVCFQQDATLHSSRISGKLLYMFQAVSPPIIRSTHNCIYSIWYLSNRYCCLSLLWKSRKWFECGVGTILIYNTVPTSLSNQLQLFHNSDR